MMFLMVGAFIPVAYCAPYTFIAQSRSDLFSRAAAAVVYITTVLYSMEWISIQDAIMATTQLQVGGFWGLRFEVGFHWCAQHTLPKCSAGICSCA